MVVIGIDPGSAKCGIAVVSGDAGTVVRKVVPTSDIGALAAEFAIQFKPDAIVIGNGTGSARTIKAVEESLSALNANGTLEIVDEYYTSEAARKQAIAEEHPVGLRRLIPRSLRSPLSAYDDIVAEILAKRWIAKQAGGQEQHI